MERIVLALVAGAALSFPLAEQSLAQAPAPPTQPAGPAGPASRQGFGGRAFHPARQRWRDMSPEDRLRFRSNAERWLQLGPEERRELRFRESLRRQRMQREAEAALQGSGLQLEAEKREAYERRYMQERKRIDRELRRELEERRQRELAPVVERLKKEFTQDPAPTSGPSTSAASASPKK